MEKILMIVLCSLTLSITSTYCCILSGSTGSCLTPRPSFGGWIYFPNGEINGQHVFIIQRPRNFGKGKSIRSLFGESGFGRIWKSDRSTCPKPAGDFIPAGQCPASDSLSRPCFNKTIPCPPADANHTVCYIADNGTVNCPLPITDPGDPSITGYMVEYRKEGDNDWMSVKYSGTVPRPLTGHFEEGFTYEYWISFRNSTGYGQRQIYGKFVVPCRDVNLKLKLSSTSRRVGMASLEAKWTVREVEGPCRSASKTITIKQMDLDNCDGMHVPATETHDLDADDRSYKLREKKPNTEYHVTVTVETKQKKYTASQEIRTQETAPSIHPENVAMHSYKRSRWLDIRWDEIPCGKRNGRMHSYSIKMTRGGVTRVHNVKGRRARYFGFSIGEEFIIQVAAINSHAMGPYCPELRGRFGKDDTLGMISG